MPLPSACSNCLTLPSLELVTGALSPSHISTFALIRGALIARVTGQGIDEATPLHPWTSHSSTGSALFEFWAYVGDIIALYNQTIAIKTRLLTAQDRRSLRQLAELLGYQPAGADPRRADVPGGPGVEILRLANDPRTPERGSIRVITEGGV